MPIVPAPPLGKPTKQARLPNKPHDRICKKAPMPNAGHIDFSLSVDYNDRK